MKTPFRRVAPFALAMLLAPSAIASDPALDRIHAQLMEVRAHHLKARGDQSSKMRGAEPVLDQVKRELRDWIEPQLAELADRQLPNGMIETVDPADLVQDLNRRLAAADLDCAGGLSKPDKCSVEEFSWDGTGYTTGVNIENHMGVLVVTTSLGIVCGVDDSAYVYQWRDQRWQRVLDDEQAIVPGKPYEPYRIAAVHTSRPDEKTGQMNVLVLGQGMWCSSNWNGNSYRIWRTTVDGKAATLLKREDPYSVSTDPGIIGSINSKEALIEFTVSDFDGDWYQTVRHFRLDGVVPIRDDPIALGPEAFVEEWIKAAPSDSDRWSETAPLSNWHRNLHVEMPLGDLLQSMRCKTADTWQVGVDFTKQDHEISKEQTYIGKVYFTVRWLPPYRFRMVTIHTNPSPDCAEPDDQERDLDRTLFPTQDRVGWK